MIVQDLTLKTVIYPMLYVINVKWQLSWLKVM